MAMQNAPMSEETALRLATAAVEELGGTRKIYRNPRHPFSVEPSRDLTIDGHQIEVRWGEVSSPAIVSVAGYVFQISDYELSVCRMKVSPSLPPGPCVRISLFGNAHLYRSSAGTRSPAPAVPRS